MSIFLYSPTAIKNLRQISRFLHERSPAAANHFLDEMDRHCQTGTSA